MKQFELYFNIGYALVGIVATMLIINLIISVRFVAKRKKIMIHSDAHDHAHLNEVDIIKNYFYNSIQDLSILVAKIVPKKIKAKQKEKLTTIRYSRSISDFYGLKAFTAFAVMYVAVVLDVIFGFVDHNMIIPFGIFVMFIAWFFPNIFIASHAKRRRASIKKNFVSAIRVVANSLQGGYSVPQSFKIVSETKKGPIAVEFTRLYRDIEVGFSLEEAITSFANRVDIPEARMLESTITINNEVGGNIIQALRNVIDTIQATTKIENKMKAATASARTSAKIVGIVPLVLFAGIWFATGGSYFEDIIWKINETAGVEISRTLNITGIAILMFGFSLQLAGYVIIQKMARIDI